MKLINRIWQTLWLTMAIVALSGNVLRAQQEPHHKTPFSYEVNIGGMAPTGKTASGPYSSSFLIGGGASLPLGRWVSLDLLSMDFGFGTTDQTQTIQVTDGTTRTTKNYQMMLGTGGRVNLPLGHKMAFGLGGGYSGVFQNEFVPDRIINNGVTTVIQSVNCTTCSRNAYQGPYMEARLFGRSNKYSGFGVKARYYIVKDSNHDQNSFLSLPPQHWLTVGVTFSFGI